MAQGEETFMYRILVCDDERDIVSALRIYLEAEGYEVVTAYTGAEALAALAEQEIHLILLDIMMPQMDGITAMTRIRKGATCP
jgi:CheY-like chemotaxis protein